MERQGGEVVMRTVGLVGLVVLALLVAAAWFGRWVAGRGGGEVVARCNQGHLFTTIWLPGVSLKAIRLGPLRIQRCPVGDHPAIIMPVPVDRLTDAQRREAARHRDVRMP
jgi:hypothetical protein